MAKKTIKKEVKPSVVKVENLKLIKPFPTKLKAYQVGDIYPCSNKKVKEYLTTNKYI